MSVVKQLSLGLIAVLATLTMLSTPVHAGPLGQWLHGRQGPRQTMTPATIVAPAATGYTFETIDVPYARTSWTVPMAINDAGMLVGIYTKDDGHLGSFRHQAAGTAYLRVLPKGALDLQVLGINNTRQIVGEYTHPDFEGIRGFYLQQGQRHDLVIDGAEIVEGMAINDSGQIAISYFDGSVYHGAIYDIATGVFTPADASESETDSTLLFGIDNEGNTCGLIIGQTLNGFVNIGGTVTLVNVPGANYTIVRVRNEETGQIWGWYNTPDDNADHGFVGTPTQGGYTFEAIDYPGSEATAILGRNAQGQLVGRHQVDGFVHGFLATPGE